jgi:uncharacterized protein YndB with AHSA1/START domain
MTAVPADTCVTFPGSTEILITRELDAPRDLVFRAWTTPDLVRRWWSGGRGTVTSIEIDLRPGGTWRYVLQADDGSHVAFRGEYREIVAGERLVTTEVLESRPGAQAVTTVTFAGQGQRTQLAVLVSYDSEQDRDAHARYMKDGLADALDLLEKVTADLAGGAR